MELNSTNSTVIDNDQYFYRDNEMARTSLEDLEDIDNTLVRNNDKKLKK